MRFDPSLELGETLVIGVKTLHIGHLPATLNLSPFVGDQSGRNT